MKEKKKGAGPVGGGRGWAKPETETSEAIVSRLFLFVCFFVLFIFFFRVASGDSENFFFFVAAPRFLLLLLHFVFVSPSLLSFFLAQAANDGIRIRNQTIAKERERERESTTAIYGNGAGLGGWGRGLRSVSIGGGGVGAWGAWPGMGMAFRCRGRCGSRGGPAPVRRSCRRAARWAPRALCVASRGPDTCRPAGRAPIGRPPPAARSAPPNPIGRPIKQQQQQNIKKRFFFFLLLGQIGRIQVQRQIWFHGRWKMVHSYWLLGLVGFIKGFWAFFLFQNFFLNVLF